MNAAENPRLRVSRQYLQEHLGTGYGLPITKRYIEAHGGKLTMIGQEDKGTTVSVLLPHPLKLEHTQDHRPHCR